VDPATVFVDARFESNGTTVAGDVAFLVAPAALALPDPGLRVLGAEHRDGTWRVVLTADRLAYGVRVSVDGVDARYSDNYVHVLPGDTVEITVTPEEATSDLPDRIVLRSLADRSRRPSSR
jgi:hypothetical protein